MNLKEEDEMMDDTVELKGKVLDLSDLSDEQKQEFKLKEKVIVDKKDNETLWIYESPDGGNTVYKRESQNTKKIKVK